MRADASWTYDPGALRPRYTAVPEDLRDIPQSHRVKFALHESQPCPMGFLHNCRHVHAHVVGKVLGEILLQALLLNPTVKLNGGGVEGTYGAGPVTRLQK